MEFWTLVLGQCDWVKVIWVFMGFFVKEMKKFLLVFSATKHRVKESKEQMRLYGLSFWYFGYLLDLGMKKIYGLFFWFSWLPNTEWGRSMWLFLWIFLATKHKIINNFILRKSLRKSLVWCWWNMKLCSVNVPLAFCHCSLPLEIPSSFALGENAQTAYHMLNCIVQNSKSLSKSCPPQHPLKQDQPYLFGTSIKKEIQY